MNDPYSDCENLIEYQDSVPYGEGSVLGPEYTICDYADQFDCENCPHYSSSRYAIEVRESAYDSDYDAL